MEQIPHLQRKKGISPIWTLPLLALGISLWVAYTSLQNAGIAVVINFEDATGLTPGKTQIIYRGIPIGSVAALEPDLSNRRIRVLVKIDKSAEELLVEDTRFWIVRPEISAASVQGLETLLSGSYIGVQPGTAAARTDTFTGLSAPPPIPNDTPGLHLKLRANELSSIQMGSGIYYRNIRIGSTTQFDLEHDSDSVLINIYIKPEYAHLVREGSRFFNASGIYISGKLTNLEVQIESLASLLKGGIVLLTPEAQGDTPPARDGQTFPLYKDIESAKYDVSMTLRLASSMGISEGQTKVIYRGLVAGVVRKIEFNEDEQQTVIAHIMLDSRAERILRSGTRFWMVQPQVSLERMENLDTLLSGPYITFVPGSGEFKNHFEILPAPPALKPLRPGSELLLTAPQSHAIDRGAPVRYKEKKVGEVIDVELSDEQEIFTIAVYIYQPYERLIRSNSVFWKDGGFSLAASLGGIELQSNSLGAVLNSGISFVTPDKGRDRDAGARFPLYSSYSEAQRLSSHLKPQGYAVQLQTRTPEAYTIGTPILYKNIEVGTVTGFQLGSDRQTVLIDCHIDKEFADTVNASSRFFDMSGISASAGLSGIDIEAHSLQSILRGGIGYITPQMSATRSKNAVYPLYAGLTEAEAVDKTAVFVSFRKSGNLRQGSAVKYKGVEIGTVRDLRFDEGLQDVRAELSINAEAAPFFRQQTRVWLEETEIGLSGIKNVNGILSGPFINIMPGQGAPQTEFIALDSPPATDIHTAEGLHIVLESKHLGSLKVDSPVFYRQVRVGRVIGYHLSETFKSVFIHINIDDPYRQLIREGTRFWKVSGTRIEGGLFSGLTLTMESLEAVVAGGIALATPENSAPASARSGKYHFPLHDKAQDEWLDWQPDIPLLDREKEPATPNQQLISSPLPL